MNFQKQSIIIIFSLLINSTLARSDTAKTIPVPIDRPAHEALTNKPIEAKTNTLNNCLIALQSLGHAIAVTPPPAKDPECIVENPVSVISISTQSGSIDLPADMLNKCTFALEFTRWIADVANPLAKQHLGSQITKVHSGNGFTCRRRNNLPTGKLSEHAYGNAIDLLGFSLADKSTISIKAPAMMNKTKARFFAALRKTACGYFTTVLGPGTNAAHATHLHLDLGIHGKTSNYRICE